MKITGFTGAMDLYSTKPDKSKGNQSSGTSLQHLGVVIRSLDQRFEDGGELP
jgi:hypothetical protein